MTEYNRTAVIAHLSQPTSAHQEGWGQPGERSCDEPGRATSQVRDTDQGLTCAECVETQFGGIYFRERIRAMYTILRRSL